MRKHKTKSVHPKRTHHLTKHAPKTLIILILVCYVFVGTLTGFVIVEHVREERVERRHLVSMSVISTRQDTKKAKPFVAPTGEYFMVVSVSLVNNSERPFDFAPVLQTYLTDSRQKHYTMSPTILDDPISAGKISPKSQIAGELSYLVPIDSRGITFHFVPNTEDAKPLNVKIN